MYRFVVGFITAFWLYSKSCAPHCPYTFNQIQVGKYVVHLHHWLLSLAALPFADGPLLRGMLVGSAAHGILMYDDWYNIIKSRDEHKDVSP